MLAENLIITYGKWSSTYAASPRKLAETSVSYGAPSMLRSYCIAKRALDICGASLGLLLLILLLPWIALCIQLEDRGPIFYKQVRIGKNGRPFSIIKLRTMVINADRYLALHPALQIAWLKQGKLRRDPRITRIGAFLRRTSLDELPQVLNILHGEMSLVGPRPVQFTELGAFGELGHLRLTVKPGLTGLWQVCGRSTSDYARRALLDSTYVLHCSFWTDLRILCKTVPVVIKGHGAF